MTRSTAFRRSRPCGAVAAASLAVQLASAAGEAADRFISTAGSDTANGCAVAAAPCRTVAHALATAASGDVVEIAWGTYAESLLIDTGGTRTLEGGWDATFGSRDPAATPTILRGSLRPSGSFSSRPRAA